MSCQYWPVGDATAKSGATLHAYVMKGVPCADVDARGTFTLDELRELRDMLAATVRRLETSGAG